MGAAKPAAARLAGYRRDPHGIATRLRLGEPLSGGSYLFRTYQDALKYKHWIFNDYVLDGVEFFDQPHFLNP
jgi:hypothetical protein